MALASPRATSRAFRTVALSWRGMSLEEWLRDVAIIVNGIMEGHSNATGSVTLAVAPATSTTLSNRYIGYNSTILLTPTTANAATAMTVVYQTHPNTTKGQAVINHDSNAAADRTFQYAILG